MATVKVKAEFTVDADKWAAEYHCDGTAVRDDVRAFVADLYSTFPEGTCTVEVL